MAGVAATRRGSPPARYVGWPRQSTDGVAVLDRELVAAAAAELSARDFTAIPVHDFLKTRDVAVKLLTWLSAARNRGDAIVVHWQIG